MHTAEGVVLVVVDPLHGNNVCLEGAQLGCVRLRGVTKTAYRIGRTCTDACHDGDEDVLLYVEWAGVERDTEDLDVGHPPRPRATDGERDQLGDDLYSGR